jgi:hypothetical protein
MTSTPLQRPSERTEDRAHRTGLITGLVVGVIGGGIVGGIVGATLADRNRDERTPVLGVGSPQEPGSRRQLLGTTEGGSEQRPAGASGQQP